jgi:hypothetical protein
MVATEHHSAGGAGEGERKHDLGLVSLWGRFREGSGKVQGRREEA